MHLSDDRIIEGCCRGNRDAMRALYERYAPTMLAVCRRYVCDLSLAQDLLHDGFVTVYAKIGDFRKEGSLEGWLRRVFVTTALGYLRKQKNFRVTDLSDSALHLPDNSVSVLDALSAGEILGCVDKLPEGYRLVLNLYAVEGYSHREIATMLGISEGTSRSQYSRARSALQKMVIDMQTSNAV